MCDPLTIAGTVATIGSTVANSMAVNAQNKARDQALAAERIRQGGLDQEAQALNTVAQDRFQNVGEQRETKSAALGDYLATAQPTEANATAAAAMPSASNDIVTREMAKKSGEAKRFTDQQAASLGDMRAFGDVLGDISRAQSRDAGQIGQIGGFKRGSSNVLPLELDAASQKGRGLQVLGDILGGVGGIGINAGLTRGPATAAAASTGAASIRPKPRPASLYPTASGAY